MALPLNIVTIIWERTILKGRVTRPNMLQKLQWWNQIQCRLRIQAGNNQCNFLPLRLRGSIRFSVERAKPLPEYRRLKCSSCNGSHHPKLQEYKQPASQVIVEEIELLFNSIPPCQLIWRSWLLHRQELQQACRLVRITCRSSAQDLRLASSLIRRLKAGKADQGDYMHNAIAKSKAAARFELCKFNTIRMAM